MRPCPFSPYGSTELRDLRERIVTAREFMRRHAVDLARATLQRVVETVFVVVDSVAAGQVVETVEGADDERLPV